MYPSVRAAAWPSVYTPQSCIWNTISSTGDKLMTNKTKRFGGIKRIFTNVWRLRSGYCILSLIAFLGAVATLFVLMMYTCASHLNRMMHFTRK